MSCKDPPATNIEIILLVLYFPSIHLNIPFRFYYHVMRYAISYLSTANIKLQDQEVTDIMNETMVFNRDHDITGILLYNEQNFFQLLEGEKQIIIDLYNRIAEDHRHHDIIKFLDMEVFHPPYDGYLSDFITDHTRCDETKLKYYLHYIEVLNPKSQKAIKRVLELMMV